MDLVTVEELRNALPPAVKRNFNDEHLQHIQATLNDPEMYDHYRDNFISYAKVMEEGKFKISNYIDAVKYVSHKLMGKTNKDAFCAVFPDKINSWKAQGITEKDQASYMTAYHKSKLVSKILEQSLIPSWVLNQDLYQKALNVQAELMVHANSEKVRSDAANSILTHLKPPETQKIQLDVGVKEDNMLTALKQQTLELIAAQKAALMAGATTISDIANSRLTIEGESTRVDS